MSLNVEKCHGTTGKGNQCSRNPKIAGEDIPKLIHPLCLMHQKIWAKSLKDETKEFKFYESSGDAASEEDSSSVEVSYEKYEGGDEGDEPASSEESSEEVKKVKKTKRKSKKVSNDRRGKCSARTKAGHLCKFNAKNGGLCGRHWNSKNGAKKVVPDSKRCTGKTAKGSRCQRAAHGTNASGELACFSHGGPTKDKASSTGGGKVSVSGTNFGIPATRLCLYAIDHIEEHFGREECENNACSQCVAMTWLVDLIRLLEDTPKNKEIVKHLAKMRRCGEEDFLENHGNTMLWVLEDKFETKDFAWLRSLIRTHRKSATKKYGAQVGELWEEVVKDLGITKKSSDPVTKHKTRVKRTGAVTKSKNALKSIREKRNKLKKAKERHLEAQKEKEENEHANEPEPEKSVEASAEPEEEADEASAETEEEASEESEEVEALF